jgi:putative flippase GtrA
MSKAKTTRSLRQALSEHLFVRFCVVGGVAFLIDAGCARLFIEVVPKVLAVALSYLLSCLFHYTCTKYWTFKEKEAASVRQIWAYAWVNLVTLLVNTTVSTWMLTAFHQNVYVAKAVALPPTSILGFVLLRYFVFRNKKAVVS